MKNTIFLLIFIFTFTFSANLVQAKEVLNEVEYRAVLLELIATLQKQILALQAELSERQNSESSSQTEAGLLQNSVVALKRYNLNYPSDINQISDVNHRAYFAQVLNVFPAEYDAKLGKLMVFEGEGEDIDAFVETIAPTNEKWIYAVADVATEETDYDSRNELIIHELGHIVSYEEVLEVPVSSSATCHTYFSYHGCPNSNSYLAQFVRRFWSASDLSRAEQFNKAFDKNEVVDTFYEQNSQKLVNDYAASSPEEDFAESFLYFVTNKNTVGTIAQQKINFFNQSEGLMELKGEVVANID